MPTAGFNNRDVGVYFNDFNTTKDYDTTNDWTETGVTGTEDGTVSITQSGATNFGILALVAGAQDGEGFTTQLNRHLGCAYFPGASRVASFEVRLTCTAWAGHHMFFGLMESDTAVISGAGALPGDQAFAGFHLDHDDVTTGIPVAKYAGTNNTATTPTLSGTIPTLTNSTYYNFGIRIEGLDIVRYYFNGVYLGGAKMSSAFGASDILYPSFAFVTNSAASPSLRIDYLSFAVTR
jgi:hypothetical protein